MPQDRPSNPVIPSDIGEKIKPGIEKGHLEEEVKEPTVPVSKPTCPKCDGPLNTLGFCPKQHL